MRTTQLLLITRRTAPADAEAVSHQLLLRAGLIRQVAAGIYNWLPLGWRVLHKVTGIIRAEMERAGSQEILMPFVQPEVLWRESGRWQEYGPELLRLRDRHDREFCLGPTHEEVVTDLVRRDVRSYKHFPLCLHQIQTKFRDEIRPRFGLLRGREFLMKDAYSFHLDDESLDQTYERMSEAYQRILSRLGLQFRMVKATAGNIGGHSSHEFHVLAESGEDQIAYTDDGDYAANVEMVPSPEPDKQRLAPAEDMHEVPTPDKRTIAEVGHALRRPARHCVKSLVVEGTDSPILLLLRGDHELNRVKAEELPQIKKPLRFVTADALQAGGHTSGFIGPVGTSLPVVADREVVVMSDFICGANKPDVHWVGVNWGRDLPEPETVADIRNVADGDPAPEGEGARLRISRGIEIGHLFKLGVKYSEAMNATCMGQDGKAKPLIMGCYGMGVSRLVAATVEQYHDDRGITWPIGIAPWPLIVIPINMHKSKRLAQAVEELYQRLLAEGLEVLLDDRPERPGVMYNDAELIGIPHWLVFSESGLDEGRLEYRLRASQDVQKVELEHVPAFARDLLS